MWNTNLKDWEKVNKEVYKFCLDQAEKRLKDVIDEGEKITSRSYTLIGVLIPVLSICVGIVLKYVIGNATFDLVVYLSIICVVILGYSLWQLSLLISIRKVWNNGTEPMNLCKSEFIDFGFRNEEDTIKYLMLSEIEQVQHKIDNNKTINSIRIVKFSNCLKISIATTITILISLLCLAII